MKGKYLKQFLVEGKFSFGVSLVLSVVEAVLTAGIGIALQKIMDTAAYGTVTELMSIVKYVKIGFLTNYHQSDTIYVW